MFALAGKRHGWQPFLRGFYGPLRYEPCVQFINVSQRAHHICWQFSAMSHAIHKIVRKKRCQSYFISRRSPHHGISSKLEGSSQLPAVYNRIQFHGSIIGQIIINNTYRIGQFRIRTDIACYRNRGNTIHSQRRVAPYFRYLNTFREARGCPVKSNIA